MSYSCFGQFFLDPYRYGISRYFSVEDLKDKKRFHDNYIQIIPSNDSLKVIINDTIIQTYQKEYRRTKKSRRILFMYFQKKMVALFSNHEVIVQNCRIIDIDNDNTYCLCTVINKNDNRRKVERREVVFTNDEIEGVVLGMGRIPRYTLITVAAVSFIKHGPLEIN